MKRYRGTWKYILLSERSLSENAIHCMIFRANDILQNAKPWRQIRLHKDHWQWRAGIWTGRALIFLGQWVLCIVHNDGPISLCICPNPQVYNTNENPEINHGLWMIIVYLTYSWFKNLPLWWVMVIMGQVMHAPKGLRVYGKSLHLPLNLTVHQNCFKKNKVLIKNSYNSTAKKHSDEKMGRASRQIIFCKEDTQTAMNLKKMLNITGSSGKCKLKSTMRNHLIPIECYYQRDRNNKW